MTLHITLVDGEKQSPRMPLAEWLAGKGVDDAEILVHPSEVRKALRTTEKYRAKNLLRIGATSRTGIGETAIVVGKERFMCRLEDV